jgi:AraC-like DNA-binding protein
MAAGQVAQSQVGIPAAPLRPFVRSYVGYRFEGFPAGVHLGLPSRSTTVVVSLSEPVVLTETPDPEQSRGAWSALASGLTTRRAVIAHDGNQFGVQLDVTPLGARALLGTPVGEIGGTVVDLADLLGYDVGLLREELVETSTWTERFGVLDSVLMRALARHERHATLRPELAQAWRLITGSGGRSRIGDVATHVGWSRRHLSGRFMREFGVGPKDLAAIVRFERARALLMVPLRPGLAEIAAICGYADQSHLTREWRRFAGTTPTAWLAGEEFPSVQDEAAEREAGSRT